MDMTEVIETFETDDGDPVQLKRDDEVATVSIAVHDSTWAEFNEQERRYLAAYLMRGLSLDTATEEAIFEAIDDEDAARDLVRLLEGRVR
jgi:hypothetical protein